MPARLFDSVRPTFLAAARGFIPETATAGTTALERMEAVIESAMASRPAAVRRQLLLFVRLLDVVSLVRHGRPLHALPADRCTALLERLSTSPLLVVRRGVWGFRTLVQMGWYGQAEVQQAIGYRATPAGWEAQT